MKTSFSWNDPLLLDQQLTDDERAVRDTAQAYCQEKLRLPLDNEHAVIARDGADQRVG